MDKSKTVKIKMNGYFKDEIELTLVFMELDSKWDNMRVKYLFIVKINGKRKFFNFWGSALDWTKRVISDPINAFECIVSDAESVCQYFFGEDWCSEMDFDYDDREEQIKANKIYNQCNDTANKLIYLSIENDDLNILGSELRDKKYKIIGEEN